MGLLGSSDGDTTPKVSGRKVALSPHRGTLRMRIGPMYAMKTTWLNGQLTMFADQGFTVLKVVHQNDNRQDVASNSPSGSTHNSSFTSLTSKVNYVRVSELGLVNVTGYQVVGVDEAQFFPDLLITVQSWVEEFGLNVIVVGLDGTFAKKPFGQVLDLIPLSDECIKKVASCQLCLKELSQLNYHGPVIGHLAPPAPFSLKIGVSATAVNVVGSDAVDVGGSEKYLAVCRYHHHYQ